MLRDDSEANWNGQADGQADRQADRMTDGQDHVLSQADALTKNNFIDHLTNIHKGFSGGLVQNDRMKP